MGIYRLSNPGKRAGNLVLRAHQTDEVADCYDMEELRHFDKATGLKLMRHFERVAGEKVFSSTEVR